MKALGWAVGALALAGLAAPAEAIDWRDIFGRDDRYYGRDPGRIAYDEGYRDGINKGERDGRKGDRYSLRRHGDYRDADDGYRRQFGPKHYYQRTYRRGFEAGYRRAYASYARRYGYGYGRDGYGYGRDGDYGRYRDRDYGRYDRGRYDRDRYDNDRHDDDDDD
jgi:hypothetical protein